MLERFNNIINYKIEKNRISISSDGMFGKWTVFTFNEEGKAIEIR